MEWYVYRYNVNARIVEKYNIFNHGTFTRMFEELRERKLDRDEFAKELNGILMYCFWSKYEYEVLIEELTDRDEKAGQKIDIYDQVKMNWNAFVDYVLGRASPFMIGDRVWYVHSRGSEPPTELTVCMLTQKADKSWKIRVTRAGGSSWEIRDDEIGQHLFRDKTEAEEMTEWLAKLYKM